MSVFAYDPARLKDWAGKVLDYLNGEDNSVKKCSTNFNAQIEVLVQPNVWTGAAAAKNYHDFLTTHEAMINFINEFGAAFENSMNDLNATVSNLEISNLGADTNVAGTFGTLNYDQLSALSEQNINKDITTYDYNSINNISEELNKILVQLEQVKSDLINKINELDNGDKMWDGDSAAAAKEQLNAVLNPNMSKIFDSLNVCISNIKTASENARAVDKG